MNLLRIILIMAALLALVFSFSFSKQKGAKKNLTLNQSQPKKEEIIVAAVGDIACSNELKTPSSCQDEQVSSLVKMINPQALLLLGDLVYPVGTVENFQKYFDKNWGQFKNITYASAGNHEYADKNALGFYNYFSNPDRKLGYYSFNIGSWHFIALNSNCVQIGGCSPSSPQYSWLKSDLDQNHAKCTVAFWHHPLFSSGPHGNNPDMQHFWELLYGQKVDLVLNGHDHIYERFRPQSPEGKEGLSGIRQFTVGTGGRSLYPLRKIAQTSEVRNNQNFGLLKLALNDDGYSWEFFSTSGLKFIDSGSALCH